MHRNAARSFWILLFLLAVPAVAAQTLYQQDSLLLQLKADSTFELRQTGTPSAVETVSANLYFVPQEDFRQTIVSFDSEGKQQEKAILFRWDDRRIEEKKYGYTALLKTTNQQLSVTSKISYPLSDRDIEGMESYLQPTKTIDSANEKIIAKAVELAEGEDDLFKVVFTIANWVEENVNYDLNTVTQTASLPASWVLENREGVCDEMTSLFVAMNRALGIPARFVSGISYTTSPLFAEPWQPHGWAEVYFPDIGWVGFDITFGEYGYIDVTHIKLRDGFDPTEPATEFEWLGKNVQLVPETLDFDVSVAKQGFFVPESIQLEQEILSSEVGVGSYNLIKGVLKNNENRYAATTLTLAVPKELEVLGRNKRTILLLPKEVRETYWIVKVSESLSSDFVYTFPSVIYSEKNISVSDSFRAAASEIIYTQEEIEKLTISDEEKTYSRKITFDCHYPQEVALGSESVVACSIRNRGTANLHDVEFCIGEVCETVDLPINQERRNEITVRDDKAGQKKIVITAENADIEKKTVLEYVVADPPALDLLIDAPAELEFNRPVMMTITVEKKSFSVPQNIRITITSPGIEKEWSIDTLSQREELVLQLVDLPLMKKNELRFGATWHDANGTAYSLEKEISIPAKAKTWGERVWMYWNALIYLFD
ncbi:transglutaminase domain-containing protein [Candidatus Woesearchaeota archaeon]|nr:transglutaminase domain-containing protein [Candidatus Woesearchaeota archaeon]